MSENINKATPKWPGVMTELLSIITDALKREGYELEESLEVAEIVIKAMCFMAGGRLFYLPKGKSLQVALRNTKIFQAFTGNNVDQLSREYDLTQAQIYNILRVQRESAKHTVSRH